VDEAAATSRRPADLVPLFTIASQWARIGVTGFGGPPAHIVLLRKLCVGNREWLSAREFDDGVAATNLLPGPASTQLAIFCAWRLRGAIGAILGGICFIVPGLVIILALSALFLAGHPPLWVRGAAAGAGAAVPAVAVHAAVSLLPASWRRTIGRRAARARWLAYLAAGAVAGATAGPLLVAVLLACGLVEVAVSLRAGPRKPAGGALGLLPAAAGLARGGPGTAWPLSAGRAPAGPALAGSALARPALAAARLLAGRSLAGSALAAGGLGALAWVAIKVGALSFGGGFVIIPLMQHDAVVTYHWMSGAQFLNAVALGQLTPGPVVLTVAVVGYAAAGIGGGLLAVLIAFLPSFVLVIAGGPHFGRLRSSQRMQSLLAGAGPAAIGAIAGAAIPLGRDLGHLWQAGVLLLAAGWLLAPSWLAASSWLPASRRGVVAALLGSAALGVIAVLAGAPVSR
jgi:chromate transporter